MIDGKQTYMSSADVANLLKSMPSSQVKASNSSPILRQNTMQPEIQDLKNIKTKKSNNVGTNGTLTAGTGYGDNYRSNAGLSLNHRNRDINIFGNYNFSSVDRAQI